ncbi:hypothetical protein K493DRAFT_318667 [Basidiobolus meristosporus CBS 931.73]|uniref:MYND-type domain-containing protein n=1 Tax=Basidiobolus meristosporus CBS 931.73 TaxID=1314790 RepID=A0A1Y1XUS4_9FUNG|nr:hypothetical protein K493DRAFT_318667 [Basidiobolus meristosporus CBS 931.73]|eukprot:ORX89435.1 hypothetical protein K493DRAFT_318667 [Basidiobolus meristosporus CBS 931.73]
MRESNFSFPAQNRACVTITSALYDRRALDCTAILPLINSLSHLIYLTSTSPRIREIITKDGGLERLVRILKTTKLDDKRQAWKWSMAFQCVVNVGVRGTETIRTRVVDAGMVDIVIQILKSFQRAVNQVKMDKEKETLNLASGEELSENLFASPNSMSSALVEDTNEPISSASLFQRNLPSLRRTLAAQQLQNSINSSSSTQLQPLFGSNAGVAMDFETLSEDSQPSSPTTHLFQMGALNRNESVEHANPPNEFRNHTAAEEVLYREEDILLSLQLLAYVSKYPHLRQRLHSEFECNVFSLVEKFTSRGHSSEIQCWASIIMRNACRKDEARGGIRQCGNMSCGKWERYPREFSKCRRCRKAKYCSKICQSKAWADGHRHWCVERQVPESSGNSTAQLETIPVPQNNGVLATSAMS